MSWDAEALIRQIQESTITIEQAAIKITELRKRIADLEHENEYLRTRLTRTAERMRRMEQGEL